MAEKASSVVLNFKMDGQVKYAETLKQINSVMNVAAKEYKNHIASMGKDGSATEKLSAEKKKLEIQMEGAQKRTKMLSDEFEAMSKDTSTTTEQLTKMQGKLLDSERAEISLQQSLDRVNEGLTEQAIEARDVQGSLDKLKIESSLLEAEQKKLTSSFKLQTAELGDNATESDKAELAQKQLASQMGLTDRAVANLEQQLQATKTVYGENSTEVMQMETKLNDARTTISKFNNSLEDIEDSSKEAKGSIGGLKDGLAGIASAAGIAAVGGLVEGMQETNQQLAMLEIQAQQANLALDDFGGARSNFAAVGQDVGQTVEAMGNLTQAGYDTKESLNEISEGISGAIVKYGETFTSEGLAESINSTSQLGEVTGQLTDLLEKEGMNVEDFNGKLAGMATTEERANFISQSFSEQGLNSMYDKYVEMNPEITKNAEAQLEQQEALSQLSVILTPIITQVAEFTTKLIEWVNENPKLAQGIAIAAATIGTLIAVVGALTLVMTPITGIIIGVVAVIAGIVLVIKNWGSIMDWLGDKWGQFIKWIGDGSGQMKEDVVAKFTELKDKAIEKFNELKEGSLNKINELKEVAVNKFNSLKDSAMRIFDDLKDKIMNPINKAKELMKSAIETMKGFFDFEWSIPKPKTPKISVDMKENSWGIPYPDFDIKWNAKGGIFNQPTIFGASGGQLQGIGEAGPEAALPLNEQTLGAIGRGIAETMGNSRSREPVTINNHFGQLNTNSPSELAKLDRRMKRSADFGLIGKGGVPV